MNALARLREWFDIHGNGSSGEDRITIRTFSNPCWFISILLDETPLIDLELVDYEEGIAETVPWAHCYLEANVWKGAGDDPERLIELFLVWAQTRVGAAKEG